MTFPTFLHRALYCAFLVSALYLLPLGCDDNMAGVISTGNAGRIHGKILSDGSPDDFSVRLIHLARPTDLLVDSGLSDTSGSFVFQKVEAGSYRVEAWRAGRLQGRSQIFAVNRDSATEVVVVLVQPIRFLLDVSSIGSVDSTFIDYPENLGLKQGNLWSLPGLKGDSGTLYTHVTGANGGSWLSWLIKPVGDTFQITGISSTPGAPLIRRIDTSAFLVAPHTIALWTFDSVTPNGSIPDLSGHGCDLAFPIGGDLVASPHGMALSTMNIGPNAPAKTKDKSAPRTLSWARTGLQTIEMRIRIDSFKLGGYVVAGSYIGPQIAISNGGAIAVFQQAKIGSDTAWFGTMSDPDICPKGRWFDIAVGIDAIRSNLYLWLNGLPVAMYPTKDAMNIDGFIPDSTFAFDVGGAEGDSRVGNVLIDEVKISDTLVYGTGLAIQPAFQSKIPMASTPIGSGVCSNCVASEIGGVPEHALYLTPRFSARNQAYRVASAHLILQSTATPKSSASFIAYRLLRPVDMLPTDPALLVAGRDIDPEPAGTGALQVGSKGGAIFEISKIVQQWINTPDQSYGLVIRSNTSASAASFFGSKDSLNSPFIELHYH